MSEFGCPNCGSRMSRVLETREVNVFGLIFKARIRSCSRCGKHYRTREVTDDTIVLPHRNKDVPGDRNQ